MTDHHDHAGLHTSASLDKTTVWDTSNIELSTIGIDIGSTTTHFSVSKLRMNLNGDHFVPAGATLVYQSPILLTPYTDNNIIDIGVLTSFFNDQYKHAGISRDEVDTGVVILTGVAADRSNARLVAELFADNAGKFVSISAGHILEAELGVRGSGALAVSRVSNANLLHIDIGGGTTKFAYCRSGEIVAVAAIAVGARLITIDNWGTITRIETAGETVFRRLGLDLSIGDRIGDADITAVCEFFADRIFDVIQNPALSPETSELMLTAALHLGEIDLLTFSGGVAEYIYGRSYQDYGDLGLPFAKALQRKFADLALTVAEPKTGGIRATVMGASRFTVHLSSQTVFIEPVTTIPLQNIPAVLVDPFDSKLPLNPDSVFQKVKHAIASRTRATEDGQFAIALRWQGIATYERLDITCRGILRAAEEQLVQGSPLIVVVNNDFARLIGLHIREERLYDGPLVVIDNIDLHDGDFIDISTIDSNHDAILVIIKTLLFPS